MTGALVQFFLADLAAEPISASGSGGLILTASAAGGAIYRAGGAGTARMNLGATAAGAGRYVASGTAGMVLSPGAAITGGGGSGGAGKAAMRIEASGYYADGNGHGLVRLRLDARATGNRPAIATGAAHLILSASATASLRTYARDWFWRRQAAKVER
jgi:hypothetical protein